MRRNMWVAAMILLIAAPITLAAQGAAQSGQTQAQGQTQSQTKPQAAPAQAPTQPTSVADAARKSQQNQKTPTKAPVVFTNENLPRSSTISVVGGSGPAATSASTRAQTGTDEKSDEKLWRQKFADARYKLQQDRLKLVTLQSEYNSLGFVRYFTEDDAATKQKAIVDQQKQIDVDQKALDDLADNLRKAGGDPAWAR